MLKESLCGMEMRVQNNPMPSSSQGVLKNRVKDSFSRKHSTQTPHTHAMFIIL